MSYRVAHLQKCKQIFYLIGLIEIALAFLLKPWLAQQKAHLTFSSVIRFQSVCIHFHGKG